jgi:threonine synthase
VYRRLVSRGARGDWVVVATAHPAKFNEVVEPQIGREVPMPEALQKLMARPRSETELEPTLDALRAQLQNA